MLRLATVLLLLSLGTEWALAENEPQRVVYEIPTAESILTVLKGIQEHLASSKTPLQVVVVAYGKGANFLLEGAKDEDGRPFAPQVQALVAQNVQFRVCGTTAKFQNIDPSKVIPEGKIVPSGREEVERLQKEEGYVLLN
jgi:uncharacterized protein